MSRMLDYEATIKELRLEGNSLIERGKKLVRTSEELEVQWKDLQLLAGSATTPTNPQPAPPKVMGSLAAGLPEMIPRALREGGGQLHRGDILAAVRKISPRPVALKNIAPILTKLKDEGTIRPLGGGVWQLTK